MRSGFLVLVSILVFSSLVRTQPVSSLVNPFIGTSGGGNTFPGAVRPWGMVSVSPHNAPGAPSGYIFGAKGFRGLGHVHLSGTGCADLGSIVLNAVAGKLSGDPETNAPSYAEEKAEAGYYGVSLPESGLRLEATATERCGMTRIISAKPGEVTVTFDAGQSLNLRGGGAVNIRSATEAEGYTIAGGFCGEANRQTVYFAARLSTTPLASGTWVGNVVSEKTSAAAPDSSIGCWFRIGAKSPIVIKVGISYVSIANAWRNMETEIPGWDFEAVRSQCRQAWEHELGKIRVDGGQPGDDVKFYTALYHSLIHPNIISDVNGEYPLMGRTGVGRYTTRERYSVFSLWDTYRTLHPLLTLLYPERQSAILSTMVDMYRESGWLPKWELAGNETHMMVGDGAVTVIADSYVKGIRDFDVAGAYEASRKDGTTPGPESDPIRPGYHEYLQYGYIPFEQDTLTQWWVWGPVSTTLEYNLADWAFGQFARMLGKTDDANTFEQRALYYRNIFDPALKLVRPKLKNGKWLAPFDPMATEGSGSWGGSGGPGFVEGNAWQYSWFVPHDVPGLVELFGGPQQFTERLLRCFADSLFTINNEPDIAYPYLFTYVKGEEHRTAPLVQSILKKQFGTGPNGLPGNDDAGAISAWYVFSSLGFYPACPASPSYQLGSPVFSKATLHLSSQYYGNHTLVIQRDAEQKGIRFNGNVLPKFQIGHTQLTSGGTLVFGKGF